MKPVEAMLLRKFLEENEKDRQAGSDCFYVDEDGEQILHGETLRLAVADILDRFDLEEEEFESAPIGFMPSPRKEAADLVQEFLDDGLESDCSGYHSILSPFITYRDIDGEASSIFCNIAPLRRALERVFGAGLTAKSIGGNLGTRRLTLTKGMVDFIYDTWTHKDTPTSILFMDIDGPLITAPYSAFLQERGHRPEDQFDPLSVAALNRIYDETGASIVVSSMHRESLSKGSMSAWFERQGVKAPIYSMTGRGGSFRGTQIAHWLKRHTRRLEAEGRADQLRFAIVDDDSDMGSLIGNLVRVSYCKGIAKPEEELIKHLILNGSRVNLSVSDDVKMNYGHPKFEREITDREIPKDLIREWLERR